MKRTLLRDIKKSQLVSVTLFAIIIFLLSSILIWRNTLSLYHQRLWSITKHIEAEILDHRDWFSPSAPSEEQIREVLEDYLEKIIVAYRQDFTMGFYSRASDRVIIGISNVPNVKITGLSLSMDDPGRSVWESGKIRYSLLYSKIRQDWILKCDNPIVLDGEVIGHSFANVKLSSLITFIAFWILVLLFFVSSTAYLSLLVSQRITGRIKDNLKDLLLIGDPRNNDYYYEEFDKIASVNRQIYQELKLSEATKDQMLSNFPWGYVIIDNDAICRVINENGARSLGLSPDDLINQPLNQWTELNLPILETLRTKATLVQEVWIPIRPTRKERLYFSCSFPMILESGQEGAMAWFVDITEAEQTKAQLADYEKRMAIILESVTDAFYALDLEWRFTYINKKQEQFMGKSRDAILGRNIWETFPHLIDTPIFEELHHVMEQKNPTQFEYYTSRHSSWWEITVYPFPNGISVFSRDITDRKEAEKSISHMASIVASSEDAIFSMDLKGIILSWNPGAIRLYGYQPHEIIGQNVTKLIPRKDWDHAFFSIQKLSNGESVYDWVEATRICHDGTPKLVSIKLSPLRNDDGRVMGISAIHRDISGRREAEMALAAERERLAVTLDSIGDGVIAVDPKGRILLINRAGQTLTGWRRDEAIGQPLENVFYVINDQTSEVYEHIAEDVQALGNPLELEKAVLVTRDLREIRISCNCSPIKGQFNEAMGVVIVFQDISERIRVEAELLKAEKLESLGVLAGGIAHDFNNILAASLTNLQLALIKLKQGETISSYIKDTLETIYKASHLTKQLLTFSKGGAPVKKAASIGELLIQNAEFILRGSKVKSRFNIPEDLWSVEIDEGQISQVIYNLVLNAKQAMPRGGFIDIVAENCEDPITDGLTGRYIRITITDEGVGIPQKIQTKIFDPFFTTKSEGTGLGLSMSYSIIKRHGGIIIVDSKPDHGTVFTIYLPATTMELTDDSPESEIAATGEGLRILLMDDEESILSSVGELLLFHHHHVEYAKDGQEAIQKYLQAMDSEKPFDISIMDLTIPGGMGGQETMAYLRDYDPKIRAIVSSGYANDPILAEYERYGFAGAIVKPFTYEELITVIHSVARTNG